MLDVRSRRRRAAPAGAASHGACAAPPALVPVATPPALPTPQCAVCNDGAPTRPVSDADVQSALERSQAARRAALRDLRTLESAPDRPVVQPEDGTVAPGRYWMTVDPTRAADRDLLRSMAEIGRQEGFGVTAFAAATPTSTAAVRQLARDQPNVTVAASATGNPWVEDDREIRSDGSVAVPARFAGPRRDAQSRQDALVEDTLSARRARLDTPEVRASWGRTEAPSEAVTGGMFGGQVMLQGSAAEAAQAALTQGRTPTENLTFFEGGNVLRGQRTDGQQYAVVGLDSIAMARGNLSRELGRTVSDDEARRAVAYDLGIPSANLVGVEQPGTYHIDMAMMTLPNGGVVLNDAREAARLQAQWLREDLAATPNTTPQMAQAVEARIATITRDADQRGYFEDMTVRDLQRQGIPVQRMAGVFNEDAQEMGSASSMPMNFLNGEGGVAPDRSHFLTLLGGDPRAQAYVQQRMTEIGSGYDRIHFLPTSVNENLLSAGGLNCRLKGEGTGYRCPSCGRFHPGNAPHAGAESAPR